MFGSFCSSKRLLRLIYQHYLCILFFFQRVYGITTATVKVGYEYSDCGRVVWHVQTARLAGHGMGDTDLGGWELSAHHRYNFHAGILQKGDGNTVYLKFKPQVVQTVMGTGEQRTLDCYSKGSAGDCPPSGAPASRQRLLGPKALAAGPDGSVYVADYNLVRKISPDGRAATLLKLK